jgi:dimethylhistidine N-methyltransferase
MTRAAGGARLGGATAARRRFLEDVLDGLARRPRELPCKYFYDAAGSALFERICELDEYYPTRTELAILEAHAGEMAELLGERCLVIEPGSGSGCKTRLLLERLRRPAGYVPVDISAAPLRSLALELAREHPGLEVLPVCADYTAGPPLPLPQARALRRVVFFPGSTIGNLHPHETLAFLKQTAALCGRGGGLLVGVDLPKARAVLERAYDDAQGVTARFNRNLLQRIDRELGADFDPDAFRHRALWCRARSRVEMHLVAERGQTIHLAGRRFEIEPGESIRTECSYKWSLRAFRSLASAAGWRVRRVWTDSRRWFSVQYLTLV